MLAFRRVPYLLPNLQGGFIPLSEKKSPLPHHMPARWLHFTLALMSRIIYQAKSSRMLVSLIERFAKHFHSTLPF